MTNRRVILVVVGLIVAAWLVAMSLYLSPQNSPLRTLLFSDDEGERQAAPQLFGSLKPKVRIENQHESVRVELNPLYNYQPAFARYQARLDSERLTEVVIILNSTQNGITVTNKDLSDPSLLASGFGAEKGTEGQLEIYIYLDPQFVNKSSVQAINSEVEQNLIGALVLFEHAYGTTSMTEIVALATKEHQEQIELNNLNQFLLVEKLWNFLSY